MTRHWLAALAAGLMLPTVAAAQVRRTPVETNWNAKFRITPYVGFSPGFKSKGTRAIYTGGAQPQLYSEYYEFDYAAGPVTGLSAEFQVAPRYSIVASAAWNNRNHTTVHEGDGDLRLDNGSQFWFAKLGASLRMLEVEPDMQMRRINAAVFAGAALIREIPETSIFSTSAFTSGANHYGANVGAEAELPFANRKLAFQAALEDYLVFWSKDALYLRYENETMNAYGPEAISEISADRSNFLVMRVGLAFRFGGQ
jgi:hypothetical protein